jgi:hypothetical protein
MVEFTFLEQDTEILKDRREPSGSGRSGLESFDNLSGS